MAEAKGYQPMLSGGETEMTSPKQETKAAPPPPETKEEKRDHRIRQVAVASEDWPIDLYRPVRVQNWTRDPIKYNPSQEELMFIDRTFCQLIGGAAALVSALYGLISLAYYPWWVVLPYALAVWGLFVGCCWDLYNECAPVNRWFTTVKSYRSLNASFVTIFCCNNVLWHLTADYNYLAKSVPLDAWYFVNIMVATYCGFNAWLGQHRGPGPMFTTLLYPVTTQLIILISAKVNGIPEYDSPVAFSGWILLIGFSVLGFVSLLVAMRLALYHAIICIDLFMLTFALQSYTQDYCEKTLFATAEPNLWYIWLGFVIGMFLVYLGQPLQRETTRRRMMNTFWFRLWAQSLSQAPWDPPQLDLRRNKNQPFLGVKAWWMGSRSDGTTGFKRAGDLCIPRHEFVPVAQQVHVDGAQVKFVYGQEGMQLDAKFAHANNRAVLARKLRFTRGQDGAYWYPSSLAFTGPPPAPTPSIVQAKYQGTLLEFLVWYGHLNPMLRKVKDEAGSCDRDVGDLEGATHVIDLDWMAAFDVKPDYHRCGGRAYFRLDPAATRLHVVFLTKPRDNKKIYPLRLISGETDWKFDQAEQIILTSAYVLACVGYHHIGIHVMMSLVAVALHNGFDTNDGDFFHPWRTVMNVHFYNHIAVSDSVVGPWFESNALFSQIFPFTTRGLYDFLQHVVEQYDYLSDADLDARKAVFDGVIPEMGTLNFETRYMQIYRQYAQMIADACWKNDADVAKDSQMQNFIKNLNSNIPKGLPARFKSEGSAKFTTKAQVVEFTAAAIHMVTVRHEVYGTLFWTSAIEPYIMQSKLPLDFGPPAVADYQALVGFAIASSRKPAPKLMVRPQPMPGEKTTVGLPKNAQGVGMKDFKHLIRALPEEDDAGSRKAFDYLQGALNALFVDVAGTREKRDKAAWFLNITPEMLELGAAY